MIIVYIGGIWVTLPSQSMQLYFKMRPNEINKKTVKFSTTKNSGRETFVTILA